MDDRYQTERHHTALHHMRWKRSLKAKTIAWTIIVSVLPALAVGTVTYYLFNQQITKQNISDKQINTKSLAESKLPLQGQLSLLLIETGVTAVLAGIFAAVLVNRTIRPSLNAADSTTTIDRLSQEKEITPARVLRTDKLVDLETNTSVVEGQMPNLPWKREAAVEQFQVLLDIIRQIREALSEEDVLKIVVEESRRVLATDRVVIFRFDEVFSVAPSGSQRENVDSVQEGNYVAESVAPSWPKILWTTIRPPSFAREEVERYHKGRPCAIDDIYRAILTVPQIRFLEQFAVKAFLVAPILKDKQLFGLLIAHQCSSSRCWQQPEIDLFTQLASQVGYALDHARLIEKINIQANYSQTFINIISSIRESLSEEEILATTVEEVRKALRTDRVLVYGFDANWYGTVVAESVLPGWSKALWARIKDPCFEEGYIDKYQAGRVQATNNIYEAGLTDCYLGQLEPFGVKANLVAPILKEDKLFGLLIAHECSGPRTWQQSEINLFKQLGMQVGFALDHARLLQRVDVEVEQTQLLADISRRIRESLSEEEILATTVEEVRKALRTDRVLVYGFDANWYGTVVAESVLPGWPKALWARIKDPCFEEGYIDKYQAGRVQATNNIYEAGLTDCYLGQLEPFGVKANLVAPILKEDKLFGLLIAHECSGPRTWQQSEINLFKQLGMQVGFALDHARLLDQVQRAYQAAETAFHQERQQKETLQQQVSELLSDGRAVVKDLSTKALGAMESVTVLYNQIQAAVDSAREVTAKIQQAELQTQQTSQKLQAGKEIVSRTVAGISAIKKSFVEIAERVKHLDQASQKLSEVVNLISHVASQIQLQAMSTALEAARTGEAGQEPAAVAEINSLVQRLEAEVAKIKPIGTEIWMGTHDLTAVTATGTKQVMVETRLVEAVQQELNQIAAVSVQMSSLMEELVQSAAVQAQTSISASNSILEVATLVNNTSEQSQSVADSFTRLVAIAQQIQGDTSKI